MPIVGTSTARQEWTLRDVARSDGGSTARLAAAFTIEPDPSAAPPTLGPMPMPLHLGASSGESDVLFDLSRGRVQRAATTIAVPAKIRFLPAPKEPSALRRNGLCGSSPHVIAVPLLARSEATPPRR
jgi:hypothetical protein